jgi:hypothetical protein
MQDTDVVREAEIRRVLTLYCRAVDRCDAELLSTVFHEDATVDYGIFKGSAKEFIDFIIPMLESYYSVTSHCIHNFLAEPGEAGGPVFCETYAVVHDTRLDAAGTRWFEQLGCRYADTFEQRDGQWRISHRVVVLDWNVATPAPVEYSRATADAPFVLGARDRSDFTYTRQSEGGTP